MEDDEDWMKDIVENPNKVKATDEFWKEIDSHPAFATSIDTSKDLPPDIAAIQALKYESEDPIANATSYKEEGNFNFSDKNYKLAIENYTTGLNIKADDAKLNAVLYTNRAMSNFKLGNFRSCIKDCQAAITVNGKHIKAYVRGAMAAFQIEKMDECQRFCVDGLKVDPSCQQLRDFQKKVLRKQMEVEKTRVKKLTDAFKSQKEESDIRKLIQSRGMKIGNRGDSSALEIPAQFRECVYLDQNNLLHWPILFLYPEFSQTDFLKDNAENTSLLDCLRMVFNPLEDPPNWDQNRVYSLDNGIEVYIEDSNKRLKRISLSKKISEIILNKSVLVRRDLVLVFTVVSNNSQVFYKQWHESLSS